MSIFDELVYLKALNCELLFTRFRIILLIILIFCRRSVILFLISPFITHLIYFCFIYVESKKIKLIFLIIKEFMKKDKVQVKIIKILKNVKFIEKQPNNFEY